MKSTSIASLVVAVASLFLSSNLVTSQNPLLTKSFSVRTKITSVDQEFESTQIDVEERYSSEQARARIDFKFRRKPVRGKGAPEEQVESGAFYLDAQQKVALLINGTGNINCKLWTVDALNRVLGLDAIPIDNDLTQGYIVGPARLMLLADRYRDKMSISPTDSVMKIRNLDTIVYSLDYASGDQQLRLDLYYSKVSLSGDSKSLPLEIHIFFGSNSKMNTYKSVIIVDCSQVEYLDEKEEETNLWASRMVRAKQQVAYDPFILEPAMGCSAVLSDFGPQDALAERLKSATKFSFRAEVELLAGVPMQCFVAYDANLKTMRMDRLDRKGSDSGVKRQIFSLDLNRMYHVMQLSPGSFNTIDMILDLSKGTNPQKMSEAATENSQCMVAKLWPRKTAENDISLGRMLTGADKFVYLGKARVRGIRALVYEAFSGASPFWLEQPVVYFNTSTDETIREPDKGPTSENNNGDIVITVLLYVAENLHDQPILLIELYKFDKVNKIMLRQQRSLSIYDFTWDIDAQTAEGDRQAELFSLGDFCAAGLGKNVYARIDLELESSESLSDEASELLSAVHSRDAALLSSLHNNLHVPVTMIFDLESRFIQPAAHSLLPGKMDQAKELVRVSFRVAEHVQDNVELIYVGQGSPKPYASDRSLSITRNFQACFFLAAHLRFNTYFGYNPNSRMCAILTTPIKGPYPGDPRKEKPSGFTKGEGDSTELYRISHSTGARSWEPNNFLRNLAQPLFRVSLLNKKINLITTGEGARSEFTIKRLEVDERDLKNSLATGEGARNERQLDTSRFLGFALNETAPGNRRVAPAPLSAYIWHPTTAHLPAGDSESSMTLDQCRASCLAEVDCRSFSICIRNSELHCVLSKTSFRSVGVAEQLEPDVVAYYKSGSTIKVRLGDQQQVDLIKQPNCELHNIVYLDLFKEPSPSYNTIGTRYLYPVDSVEQCAKLFVEHNLKVMREDIRQAANSLSALALGPQHDLEALRKQLAVHQRAGRNLQRNFLYMDVARRNLSPYDLESRVRKFKPLAPELIDGYCVLSDLLEPEEEQRVDADSGAAAVKSNMYFLDLYTFKYELFYERRFGIKLKGSPLDASQQKAYDLVNTESDKATEEMFQELKSLVEMGNNFKLNLRYDISSCARTCYQQILGPWPACRSYDIYVTSTGVQMCQLNSITLRQAIATQRFDLIEDSSEQVSHYEPHSGFTLEEALLWSEVELAKEGLFSGWQVDFGFRLHLLGSLFIVLLALTGGAVLGVILGRRVVQRLATEEQDELVASKVTVEFSNLVNEEGAIA